MIKDNLALIFLGMLFCFPYGCRQDYVPTDDELADYGWVLFSQKDYIGARDWFKRAVEKDTSYMDGYCGLGWSNGKMGYADTAYNYLFQGKDLAYDDIRFPNQVNLPIDLVAGLVFASRAMGNDALTITYSQEFDFKQNQIQISLGDGTYRWKLKEVLFNSLSYNSKIDAQDIRLAWSTAQYNQGAFSDCVSNMRIIWADVGIDTVFEPDISSVHGRNQIAKELEVLQIKLSL